MSGSLTVDYFLTRLRERVSHYDARLILESALTVSGVKFGSDALDKEQATNLCLELIRKGGPAFQVGAAIYRQIPQ